MTLAFNRTLPRTVFAAGLAVVGTFMSFAATTSPAQAQTARNYTAVLATKLEAPKRVVLNGAIWSCKEDKCIGGVDGSSPTNACARVVKEFGALTQFATPKGELSADKLQRCNAAV